MNNFVKLVVFVSLLMLVSSCVTKKKKGDVSWLNRHYQDMTAKYNGYFNANELYNESIASLEDQYQPNYNQLLDIYPEESIDNPKSVAADMDKVIEKVSTIGSLKEQSHWLDDCYVMMGKAQFIKQDYESAEETFTYFVEEFDPTNPASQYYQNRKDKNASAKAKKHAKEEERKVRNDEKKEVKKEKEKEKKEEKKKKEEAKKEKKKLKKEEKKQREKEKKEKAKQKKEEKKQREKAKKEAKKKRKKSKRGKKKRPEKTKSENKANEEQKSDADNKAKKETKTIIDQEKEETVEVKEEAPEVDSIESEVEKEEEEEVSTYTLPKNYLPNEQGGMFKHNSVYSEGMLWLAKTYIARQNWVDADYLLRKLSNFEGISDKTRTEIPVVQAQSYIKQKKYTEAIPLLDSSIKQSKNKEEKARWSYIKGQIYKLQDRPSEAIASFREVLNYTHSTELILNTELSIAKASLGKGETNQNILDLLARLEKDSKNQKYLDQLYFASGQIKFEMGDEKGGIEDFQKALEMGSTNVSQKGEIYYTIADMYYAKMDIVKAKENYDLAASSMDRRDSRYSMVNEMSIKLRPIARNIEIITIQDSLLKVGAYSDDKLHDWAVMMIELDQEEKSEPEASAEKSTRKSPSINVASSGIRLTNKSKFFAYNPGLVQKGERDFQRKWGDRPLVDNWRRSDAINQEDTIVDSEETEQENNDSVDNDKIEKLLREIPITEKQRLLANLKIEKALHGAGTALRTQLNAYQLSIDYLSRLEADYPINEYMEDVLYYLFLDYADLNNNGLSNSYKKKLLQDYPDSKYSLAIQNPNYYNDILAKEKEGEVNYENVYRMYTQGQYDNVIATIDKNKEAITENIDLAPKYDLLLAMSKGGVGGKEVYIKELNDVIARYPKSKESTRAKEIKRFLKGDKEAFDSRIYEEELEKFDVADDKLHFIMVVLYDINEEQMNQAKIAISKYNNDFHKTERLKITNIILNIQANSQIVLVRRFPNKGKALEYIDSVEKNSDSFVDDENMVFEVFAINQHNYREVIKQKTVKEYRVFFQKNYE